MNHRTHALVGAIDFIYALDRDGVERAMTLEDFRQEAISFFMNDRDREWLMAQPFLRGTQTTRATATLYVRKHDGTATAMNFPSLAAAMEVFHIETSPLQQNQARPNIYAACFDLTRPDRWIPAAEFPGSRH